MQRIKGKLICFLSRRLHSVSSKNTLHRFCKSLGGLCNFSYNFAQLLFSQARLKELFKNFKIKFLFWIADGQKFLKFPTFAKPEGCVKVKYLFNLPFLASQHISARNKVIKAIKIGSNYNKYLKLNPHG